MSDGEYSRSASWISRMSPLDSVIPRRTAAPLPRFSGCVRTLTWPWRSASRASSGGEVAVEPGGPREPERGVVGRAVVDQQDLEPEVELEQLVDDLTDRRGLVVDRHDD